MKMLVVFEKTPRLRHIGHLDLMRAIQRSLRRSGLPIRYSQGFNPHMLMSFAAPLALGHAALALVRGRAARRSGPGERDPGPDRSRPGQHSQTGGPWGTPP